MVGVVGGFLAVIGFFGLFSGENFVNPVSCILEDHPILRRARKPLTKVGLRGQQ